MGNSVTTAATSRWNIALIVLTMGIGVELLLLGMNLLPRRGQTPQVVAQASVPSPAAAPTSSQPAAPPPSEVVIPGSEVTSTPQSVPAAGQVAASPQRWPAKQTVDHSVQGKPIIVVRFGDGPDTTFILGGFHGDEPGSTKICQELVRCLETHPTEYDGRTVIIVPAVNPDGLAAHTRVNANGVDINRNWGEGWKKARKGELSHGSGPMSEPEVKTVDRLLRRYQPAKVVNLHQAKRMLNPTGAGGIALAREMAKYNDLRVDTDIGYATPGAFGDYCGKKLGIAMVTYELPGEANPWSGAKEALLAAIKFKVPPKNG
ncbi:DUF2817 domain-containing protein [bacterium]|nr:DUF2817 domain-containing protein [bacterium]